jgi:hypothetical protein
MPVFARPGIEPIKQDAVDIQEVVVLEVAASLAKQRQCVFDIRQEERMLLELDLIKVLQPINVAEIACSCVVPERIEHA